MSSHRRFPSRKRTHPISHLLYADDTSFFLDGGKEHLLNLIFLIHYFTWVSGMKSIGKKSWLVGLNSNSEESKEFLDALVCQIRAIPIDYLGVPLGGNPRSRDFCLPIKNDARKDWQLGKPNISLLETESPSWKHTNQISQATISLSLKSIKRLLKSLGHCENSFYGKEMPISSTT